MSPARSAGAEVGDGIVHRVIMVCQRKYFDPPYDTRAAWSIENGRRSKLKDAAAIDQEHDRRFTRSSRARV
jgi:hypothetical protein